MGRQRLVTSWDNSLQGPRNLLSRSPRGGTGLGTSTLQLDSILMTGGAHH